MHGLSAPRGHPRAPVGGDDVALNLNESPIPPSPKAIAAAMATIAGVNRYPPTDGGALIAALSAHTGIAPDCSAVMPFPSFPRYAGSIRLAGARIIKVPLGADGANDTERLLAAIAEDTSIVFCCPPNGNTGGAMSPAAIRHLAERVPADVMFVVDEAYAEFDLDSRAITGAEGNALMPGAAVQFKAGIHTPSDGQAEPQKAVPAIARAAQRLGPVILTQCAVRGVERTAGRISGVVTERGAIACDAVVLAGGAWSRLFCANLGIDLPQLKLRSGALRTPPCPAGRRSPPSASASPSAAGSMAATPSPISRWRPKSSPTRFVSSTPSCHSSARRGRTSSCASRNNSARSCRAPAIGRWTARPRSSGCASSIRNPTRLTRWPPNRASPSCFPSSPRRGAADGRSGGGRAAAGRSNPVPAGKICRMTPDFAATTLRSTVPFDVDGRHFGDLRLMHSDNRYAAGYIPIPLAVRRNGAGATLLLTSGTHGDEYEGPAAILRLAHDPAVCSSHGSSRVKPSRRASSPAGSTRCRIWNGHRLNLPSRKTAWSLRASNAVSVSAGKN